MPAEVVFPLVIFGLLVYFGLHSLLHPVAAMRSVGGFMTHLQELEAALSQEPPGEPVHIEPTRGSKLVVRIFGAALVCSSLFGALARLTAL